MLRQFGVVSFPTPAIIEIARPLNCSAMLDRPLAQRVNGFPQRTAKLGQCVVDLGWDGRKERAFDEPVPLQTAQRQRQHPLRDAADAPLQLVEPEGPVAKRHYDQHAPLVADPGQDAAHRPALVSRVTDRHVW